VHYTLFDAVGKEIAVQAYVLNKGKNSTTIQFDNVAEGMYILEVRNDIGEVLQQVNLQLGGR
jgi:hypothetical protein